MGALIALALAAPIVGVMAGPASATTDVIAIAGSDTTQDVMHDMFNCGPNGACAGEPNVYNIKVPVNLPVGTDTVVPSDTGTTATSKCQTITYSREVPDVIGQFDDPVLGTYPNEKHRPAFGSGEGRTALVRSLSKTYPGSDQDVPADGLSDRNEGTLAGTGGCIDIARSSSGPAGSPSATDPVTNQYFAFAIDALGWSTASLNAPVSLTIQQLRDIYDCKYNDWAEVGGKPGEIIRVSPQVGSGTRAFFSQVILGKPTADFELPNNDGAGGHVCVEEIDGATAGQPLIEENKGEPLRSDVQLRNNYQKYIFPYSSALWNYQANNSANPTIDRRGGFRPGALVNNDAATGVPGAEPAYMVRWAGSVWRLNNATVYDGVTKAGCTLNAAGDTSLQCAAGAFAASDVGNYVQGTTITANPISDATIITAVDNSNAACTQPVVATCSIATISPGARATVLGGPAYPFTGSVKVGWTPVSEKNPNILSSTDLKYVGVRYVYNIVNTTSPSYTEARGLVGFEPTAAGALSPTCNNSLVGDIESNGFLPLPALDRNGAGVGSDVPRTCALRVPGGAFPNIG